MPTTPPPGFYFFVTIFWLVVVCTILMVLFKVVVWWGERRDMSSEEAAQPVRAKIEPVRVGSSTGSPDPVRARQNQVEPAEPAIIEPVREPLILHNLSRASLIALLAVQKNESNGYRFSKNQIAAFVGGTKADVLKEIDLYRDPPPKQPLPTRVDRPVNGWRT